MRFFPQLPSDLDELSGPTFFAVASRLAAYGGVIATRAVAAATPAPVSQPTRQLYSGQPAGPAAPPKVVSLTALRAMNPDLIDYG